MKELEINANEAGQRFDKYLKKYLKEAPDSFLYKMLRKKNIVLNGKKADGREKLAAGDRVKLFLSEETVEKFSGGAPLKKVSACLSQEELCHRIAPDILYEDSHVLLVNKPSGVLSQKAASGDISMVEYVTAYLLENGQLAEGELRTFRPSVCNRLDRNTSGIIAAGKSLAGLQALSELFRERGMGKYYLCIVRGELEETAYIRGFLKRDMKAHKVRVSEEKEGEDWLPIETEYIPLAQRSPGAPTRYAPIWHRRGIPCWGITSTATGDSMRFSERNTQLKTSCSTPMSCGCQSLEERFWGFQKKTSPRRSRRYFGRLLRRRHGNMEFERP